MHPRHPQRQVGVFCYSWNGVQKMCQLVTSYETERGRETDAIWLSSFDRFRLRFFLNTPHRPKKSAIVYLECYAPLLSIFLAS
jgi:hypothetical protein